MQTLEALKFKFAKMPTENYVPQHWWVTSSSSRTSPQAELEIFKATMLFQSISRRTAENLLCGFS